MSRTLLSKHRMAFRDFDYSLDFGELNSGRYVDFPYLFDPSTTDWTIAIFFRTNYYARDLNPWQSMAIVSQTDGSGTGRSWLGINRTGMLLEDSFSGVSTVTNFSVNNFGWFHAVVTYDVATSTRKIYVNGVLVHTAVVTIEPANGVMRIGSNKSVTRNITGNLTEFRVWNRKLSDDEVASYYFHNQFSRTNLLLEALFTDGPGSTVTDTSGNGNHGTITGAVWSPNVPPFKVRSSLLSARSAIGVARNLAS